MLRPMLAVSTALTLLLLTAGAGGTTPMSGSNPPTTATAVLGGGCFWCIEAVFEEVAGVLDAESGYAGGHTEDPDYRSVTSGETGHAEVVKVTYDPAVISYEEILLIFFGVHDPTTRNRQGADVGPQYRSIILPTDDGQHARTAALPWPPQRGAQPPSERPCSCSRSLDRASPKALSTA